MSVAPFTRCCSVIRTDQSDLVTRNGQHVRQQLRALSSHLIPVHVSSSSSCYTNLPLSRVEYRSSSVTKMRARPVPAATVLFPAIMLLLLTLMAIVPIPTTAAAAVSLITTTGPCSPAPCGRLNITYPFWLAGTHLPECGYKSFQVTCDKGDIVSLKNTYWAYKISDIFYQNSSFRIANVNLSDGTCNNEMVVNASNDLDLSPFVTSPQNQELFFLYNCSQQARQLPGSWAPVSCAKSSTNSFAWLAGKYRPESNLTSLPGNCTVSVVPVMGYEGATGADYQRLVKRGFLLQYTAVDCDYCAATGGRCRINTTVDAFECHCSDGVHLLSCDDDLFYG
ncbi:hypothetical protein PR202_gb26523 [Eleusine coracana subsp. coracana]|uniref:Wall-associated receptor kinase galacturonan-binding domain-containing protein n=1 Tax=Eleusine coracana subsp. coracana TaxID=191504 RepID=A0AAV5FS23_ELECO|nr:hypothetical protein PR202_gb26523 [Eleusine coracana subsp. coracana]